MRVQSTLGFERWDRVFGAVTIVAALAAVATLATSLTRHFRHQPRLNALYGVMGASAGLALVMGSLACRARPPREADSNPSSRRSSDASSEVAVDGARIAALERHLGHLGISTSALRGIESDPNPTLALNRVRNSIMERQIAEGAPDELRAREAALAILSGGPLLRGQSSRQVLHSRVPSEF